MSIHQDGLKPWTNHCYMCNETWQPPNARGKDQPTAASLDRAAKQHWTVCPDRSPHP
jgi:hypothetical protein